MKKLDVFLWFCSAFAALVFITAFLETNGGWPIGQLARWDGIVWLCFIFFSSLFLVFLLAAEINGKMMKSLLIILLVVLLAVQILWVVAVRNKTALVVGKFIKYSPLVEGEYKIEEVYGNIVIMEEGKERFIIKNKKAARLGKGTIFYFKDNKFYKKQN